MAGALPHYRQGPASYQVAGLILGGQLVMPNGASPDPTVKVAAAAQQTTCLGVAGNDANNTNPEGTPSLPVGWPGDGSITTQDQMLESSALLNTVSVYNNVDINVNYDSAVAFGALLQTSTSTAGSVTVWSGTNPQAIIGRCTQPGGVTAAGVGRAFIRV